MNSTEYIPAPSGISAYPDYRRDPYTKYPVVAYRSGGDLEDLEPMIQCLAKVITWPEFVFNFPCAAILTDTP